MLKIFFKKLLEDAFGRSSSFNFNFSDSSIFAHACSNPLTILESNLEKLISSDTTNLVDKESTKLALKKLTEIIQAVGFSKNENGLFNLWDAMNEVVCLSNNASENKVLKFSYLLEKNSMINGNKLFFQEALVCIINNSFEAYKSSKYKPVSLIVRKIDKSIRIDIVDYAQGMNQLTKILVHIKGVSTKSNGMGLGLYFAKRTFEDLFSGKMVLNSFFGYGTRTCLTIPIG